MNRSTVHLYHIAYSQATLGMLQPGFRVLDNLSNPRPDWYESWPIREFLMHQTLDEDAYYGFLSPKFRFKTGLDADALRKNIAASDADTDAFFVCPQAEVGAVFLNPVYGSEFTDPGAMSTVQNVLDKAGFNMDVASQVIDSTSLVYSNYVIARPFYWRRWLSLVQWVYDLADDSQSSQLKLELTHPTNYDGGVQRKVFLIECLPSLIFNQDKMKIKSLPVNDELSGRGVLFPYKDQAMVCDALKIAFNETHHPSFLDSFHDAAQSILANFTKPRVETSAEKPLVENSENVSSNAKLTLQFKNIPSESYEKIHKKIVLTIATRYSTEEFHTSSATGKSLNICKFPKVELKLFPNNSLGLPALYNTVIEEYLNQDVVLVFAHDDIHFMDWFWPDHLGLGLMIHDLVGIVGNREIHPMQPSWAFLDHLGTWDKKENLSGSIAHGHHYPPETFAEFGPIGRVKLLDGVFLAVESEKLRLSGLRFDEQFLFHFYDMDLCRSAEKLNLKLGTVAISLIHESKGSFNNQSWLEAYKAYIAKWGH
jgi:GT2 family glycosyltransferase